KGLGGEATRSKSSSTSVMDQTLLRVQPVAHGHLINNQCVIQSLTKLIADISRPSMQCHSCRRLPCHRSPANPFSLVPYQFFVRLSFCCCSRPRQTRNRRTNILFCVSLLSARRKSRSVMAVTSGSW